MSTEEEDACCPICLGVFDSETLLPMILSCGHNICLECDIQSRARNDVQQCPTCRKQISSRAKNFQLIETLKIVEKLRREKEELLNKRLDYKCSICEKWEREENLLVCETCVIDTRLLDLTAIARNENTVQVVEVAMCTNCAYRMHMQKGHKTVDMFPILSAHQFSNHFSALETVRKDYDKSVTDCQTSMTTFDRIMDTLVNQFQKMLDLARRSKSTKTQNELIQRLNREMSAAKSLSDIIAQKFGEETNALQKLIEDMEKEKVENEKNCFAEV